MAGLRISKLTELTDTDGADLLVVVDVSEADINVRTKYVKIENLIPSPFNITSFTVSPSLATMGQTVTSATFAFTANKPLDTRDIDNGVGAVPGSPHVATVSVTTNTTFTLTVTNSGATRTATASINFANLVYYGPLPITNPAEADVVGLASTLSNTRGRAITYDCTGGNYFYYAYPTRLGSIASAIVNGFPWNDWVITTVSITNAYGFTEDYYVYRSFNLLFGNAVPVTWN